MRVLAFDASTARGTVAVVDGGDVVWAEHFDSPRGRGGELFPALERAVRAAGTFDRVVVGIGPGSYNGLRAAIAAAEALHLARGVERVGVVSARALAGETEDFFALGDARGGRLWLARITAGRVAEDFALVTPEEARARVEAEPGVARLGTAELAAVPGVRVATVDGVGLARLGAREAAATGEIAPLYLKPAHITTPRGAGG